MKLYTCILLLLTLTGCAMVAESAKGIAGVSTKALEDNRKDAVIKIFNSDYNICYNKAKRVLRNIGTYIYVEDLNKRLLAVYVSAEDTTPVGFFFKQIDPGRVQIEVSSAGTYAKEYLAERFFSALEDALNPAIQTVSK